jgi:hypothetical protein
MKGSTRRPDTIFGDRRLIGSGRLAFHDQVGLSDVSVT